MYDVIYFCIWISAPTLCYQYYTWIEALGSVFIIYFILNVLPYAFGLEPMQGRDSLFLYETKTNKLLVTSIAIFSEKISLKQYKSCAKKALNADPRVKKCMVRYFGRYFWKNDPDYDDRNHYIVHSEKTSKSKLENFMTRISTQDLDFSHPPYQIHFFKNYEENKTAVIFKFHHSFCDGLAIVSMMTWCADEGSCKIFYSPKEIHFLKKLILYLLTLFTFVFYLLTTLLQKKDINKLHSQKLSGEKSISWTNKITLKGILEYCHSKHYTFNDLLTSVVLESLQEYSGCNLGTITATIPFSLRGQPKDGSFLKLENDLAIFPIEFPEISSNLPDECSKIFNSLKESIKPFVMCQVMRLGVSLLPRFLMKFLVFFVVNKATLLFSNVGGPKGPIYYGGKKYEQIIGMSPNMARCGISLTSFSYTDHFTVTCYADKNLIAKPKEFLNIVERKLQKINKKYD